MTGGAANTSWKRIVRKFDLRHASFSASGYLISASDLRFHMEGISIWWAAPFWTPFAMPSAAERPPRRDGMLGEMMHGRRAVRHAPFTV